MLAIWLGDSGRVPNDPGVTKLRLPQPPMGTQEDINPWLVNGKGGNARFRGSFSWVFPPHETAVPPVFALKYVASTL